MVGFVIKFYSCSSERPGLCWDDDQGSYDEQRQILHLCPSWCCNCFDFSQFQTFTHLFSYFYNRLKYESSISSSIIFSSYFLTSFLSAFLVPVNFFSRVLNFLHSRSVSINDDPRSVFLRVLPRPSWRGCANHIVKTINRSRDLRLTRPPARGRERSSLCYRIDTASFTPGEHSSQLSERATQKNLIYRSSPIPRQPV